MQEIFRKKYDYLIFYVLADLGQTRTPRSTPRLPNLQIYNIYTLRKIRLIEGNAKCRHLKNELYRDLAAGVYQSEAPFPSSFLFGVV
jgi:hypothetical protein